MKTKKLLAYTCFITNIIAIPLGMNMIYYGYNILFNVVLLLMVIPGFIIGCNKIFKKDGFKR